MSSIIRHFLPSHYCHISFTSARNPEQYGGGVHHVHSIQRNGLFTTGADSGTNGAKVEVLLKKKQKNKVWSRGDVCVVHGRWRWDDEEIAAESSQLSFAQGVEHFNAGEYYECHDVMEGLWNNAPEPQRSILHGILQCSVGLHHLLHQVEKYDLSFFSVTVLSLCRLAFFDDSGWHSGWHGKLCGTEIRVTEL